MKTKVKKWGNSLALRLPKALAAEVGLEDESVVELSVEDQKLVIAPRTPRDLSLDALLARVTAANLHEETDTGSSVGREAW